MDLFPTIYVAQKFDGENFDKWGMHKLWRIEFSKGKTLRGKS